MGQSDRRGGRKERDLKFKFLELRSPVERDVVEIN